MFALWCAFGIIGAAFAIIGAVCAIWAPMVGLIRLTIDLLNRVRSAGSHSRHGHVGV